MNNRNSNVILVDKYDRTQAGYLEINHKNYPIYKGVNTIGRNKDAIVNIANLNISTHHAIITIVDSGQHYISDIKSSNGTKCSNTKLKPFKLYELVDRNEIIFGNLHGVYRKVTQQDNTVLRQEEAMEMSQNFTQSFFGSCTQMLADDTNVNITVDHSYITKPNETQMTETEIMPPPKQKPNTQKLDLDIHEAATQALNYVDLSEEATQVMLPDRNINGIVQSEDILEDIHEAATQVLPDPNVNGIVETEDIHNAETQIFQSTPSKSEKPNQNEENKLETAKESKPETIEPKTKTDPKPQIPIEENSETQTQTMDMNISNPADNPPHDDDFYYDEFQYDFHTKTPVDEPKAEENGTKTEEESKPKENSLLFEESLIVNKRESIGDSLCEESIKISRRSTFGVVEESLYEDSITENTSKIQTDENSNDSMDLLVAMPESQLQVHQLKKRVLMRIDSDTTTEESQIHTSQLKRRTNNRISSDSSSTKIDSGSDTEEENEKKSTNIDSGSDTDIEEAPINNTSKNINNPMDDSDLIPATQDVRNEEPAKISQKSETEESFKLGLSELMREDDEKPKYTIHTSQIATTSKELTKTEKEQLRINDSAASEMSMEMLHLSSSEKTQDEKSPEKKFSFKKFTHKVVETNLSVLEREKEGGNNEDDGIFMLPTQKILVENPTQEEDATKDDLLDAPTQKLPTEETVFCMPKSKNDSINDDLDAPTQKLPDEDIFLMPTQQLDTTPKKTLNEETDYCITPKLPEENEDVFLMPTQKLEHTTPKEEIYILDCPTQKLPEENEEVFLMPTQKLEHTTPKKCSLSKEEIYILDCPTQKLCEEEINTLDCPTQKLSEEEINTLDCPTQKLPEEDILQSKKINKTKKSSLSKEVRDILDTPTQKLPEENNEKIESPANTSVENNNEDEDALNCSTQKLPEETPTKSNTTYYANTQSLLQDLTNTPKRNKTFFDNTQSLINVLSDSVADPDVETQMEANFPSQNVRLLPQDDSRPKNPLCSIMEDNSEKNYDNDNEDKVEEIVVKNSRNSGSLGSTTSERSRKSSNKKELVAKENPQDIIKDKNKRTSGKRVSKPNKKYSEDFSTEDYDSEASVNSTMSKKSDKEGSKRKRSYKESEENDLQNSAKLEMRSRSSRRINVEKEETGSLNKLDYSNRINNFEKEEEKISEKITKPNSRSSKRNTTKEESCSKNEEKSKKRISKSKSSNEDTQDEEEKIVPEKTKKVKREETKIIKESNSLNKKTSKSNEEIKNNQNTRSSSRNIEKEEEKEEKPKKRVSKPNQKYSSEEFDTQDEEEKILPGKTKNDKKEETTGEPKIVKTEEITSRRTRKNDTEGIMTETLHTRKGRSRKLSTDSNLDVPKKKTRRISCDEDLEKKRVNRRSARQKISEDSEILDQIKETGETKGNSDEDLKVFQPILRKIDDSKLSSSHIDVPMSVVDQSFALLESKSSKTRKTKTLNPRIEAVTVIVKNRRSMTTGVKEESDKEEVAINSSSKRGKTLLPPPETMVKRSRKPSKKVMDSEESSGSASVDEMNTSISSIKSRSSRSNSVLSTPERAKRKLKPKVVFTMMESPELEAIIRMLGGSVVDTVDSSTVLITGSVKRSQKLLTAIGQGKPICSPLWIQESKKKGEFLDPWNFILEDQEAEAKWDFKLKESITRGLNNKMLTNHVFQLIVSNAQDVLKGAIEACGGKCVSRAPAKSQANFIVISIPENKSKYTTILKKNPDILVLEPESIFDGVLRQELRFNKHVLK
ncbi:unnamed protein product [Brassicogethes aeneus]|uniref:Mediator of DNA damage checkpoint protein 1 n=1 Tax=Brassicogethes aeneus TaxID=1431903 RepID=A0A9P0AVX0_BRAAE|nr:unnamed protein product [Brassicogethes aeneus]